MDKMKCRAWDKVIGEFVNTGVWFNNTTMEVCCISDIELTWFAGKLDKNNREVWGGDIVKIDKYIIGAEFDQICEVEWDGECGYQVDTPDAGTFSLSDIPGIDLEVIGNVFKNIELLEGVER